MQRGPTMLPAKSPIDLTGPCSKNESGYTGKLEISKIKKPSSFNKGYVGWDAHEPLLTQSVTIFSHLLRGWVKVDMTVCQAKIGEILESQTLLIKTYFLLDKLSCLTLKNCSIPGFFYVWEVVFCCIDKKSKQNYSSRWRASRENRP